MRIYNPGTVTITRRLWIAAGIGALLHAQDPDFVCPMDREVRSKTPGTCPRCGMKLVAGLPMPVEYPIDFRAAPRFHSSRPRHHPGIPRLDPKTGRPVTGFETIHEKLFHLFLVSQDLEYFSHEHPTLGAGGWFRLKTRLPKPGTYRLLADFDPSGGTPQLAARTFSTAGWDVPLSQIHPPPRGRSRAQAGENLEVRSARSGNRSPVRRPCCFSSSNRPMAWNRTSARGRIS